MSGNVLVLCEGSTTSQDMGDTFRGLITWPARYLTRHMRVRFLAGIQPRRYYYYYYSLVPIQKQFPIFPKPVLKKRL